MATAEQIRLAERARCAEILYTGLKQRKFQAAYAFAMTSNLPATEVATMLTVDFQPEASREERDAAVIAKWAYRYGLAEGSTGEQVMMHIHHLQAAENAELDAVEEIYIRTGQRAALEEVEARHAARRREEEQRVAQSNEL